MFHKSLVEGYRFVDEQANDVNYRALNNRWCCIEVAAMQRVGAGEVDVNLSATDIDFCSEFCAVVELLRCGVLALFEGSDASGDGISRSLPNLPHVITRFF